MNVMKMRNGTRAHAGTTDFAAETVAGSDCVAGGVARFLGLDVGAETVKLIELLRDGESLRVGRCEILEHEKAPGPFLLKNRERWNWSSADGAAVTGRFSTQIDLPRIPVSRGG